MRLTPLTLENIRIDHQDRPNMTLEEYFAFTDAEAERPYFEFMELEILDSLRGGKTGLESRKRTSILSPKSTSTSASTAPTGTASRPGCATGETMADAIHALIEWVDSEDQPWRR